MTAGRHSYAKMYFCGNGECSFFSDSFYNLQLQQERCQLKNSRSVQDIQYVKMQAKRGMRKTVKTVQ